MCNHHTPHQPRHGSRLQHGKAHGRDHARWSRRDFLTSLSLAAAGGVFMLNGTPVRSLAASPLLTRLYRRQTDRILVLIQLSGGNDGLNTVVPIGNDLYYNARPSLAIPAAETIQLAPELGLHPSLAGLEAAYGDGRMAILQSVGYPDPNLSHFRSTDIWASASDADVIETTGWLGRYLDDVFPGFDDDPPDYPLAVRIGGGSPLLFLGPTANMGMSLSSVELFERVAQTGLLYDATGLPATAYGDEMAFVRSVANDAFKYAENIQTAAEAGSNSVAYPASNPLADNLAVVASLIKGNLGASIYQVSLGSFDTHANQSTAHAGLLQDLADGVAAFLSDLAAGGLSDRVLVMTFSEFGRRVAQNASGGTDHGTAAPLLLLGGGVEGGIYGQGPDLADLDLGGNLKYGIDFRAVYATVLQDWFGLPQGDVESVLGGPFGTLGFVSDPTTTAAEPAPLPRVFSLEQNYPNPFNPSTSIPYELRETTHVRLQVFDVQGRSVATLVDAVQPAGAYAQHFDAGRLPSGTYLYRIETPGGMQTRRMILVR